MPKIGNYVYPVAVCLAGCVLTGVPPLVAQGEQQAAPPRELQESPLEAFASRSTAKVVWSTTIGRLQSREADATITAVIIEDQMNPGSVMRGVRIDLAHTVANPSCDWKYLAWNIMCQRANAAVYVEEGRLEVVRDGINRGAAELRPFEFISQYRARDASGYGSSGLIVCGYQFSDRRPSELATLFTRAIRELRATSG